MGVKVQSIIQKPHDPEQEAKENAAKKNGPKKDGDDKKKDDKKDGDKEGGDKKKEGSSDDKHKEFKGTTPPEHYKLPPGRHLEEDHPWAKHLNPPEKKEDS